MNIETVNELIQSLESAGELSIKERKYLELAREFKRLAAENKRLTDVAQGGAFVMQKALMKYEFGVGMAMQAEDFIRDAREKHPATDRVYAGIKADGVEEFVSNTVHKIFDESEAVSALAYLSLANSHVKQLREGADK
ncbi:TPA: hypothetical protein SMJ07_004321 [Klebsiella oxytoca]|nr:hypothetical protein [Klebsiella oxytoca]